MVALAVHAKRSTLEGVTWGFLQDCTLSGGAVVSIPCWASGTRDRRSLVRWSTQSGLRERVGSYANAVPKPRVFATAFGRSRSILRLELAGGLHHHGHEVFEFKRLCPRDNRNHELVLCANNKGTRVGNVFAHWLA